MSPCIDAGDPSWPLGDEPDPHGYFINMGAYGGTNQASKKNVPPDRFEPNDRDWEAPDLGTLGNRTETGLTIHDSDDNDYYLLTAADSGTLNVDILFSHSLGDLDLIVFDSYTMLGRSSTRTDNESLSVEVIGGETYWVRVYGLSGATHPDYDLVIDGPGAPDRFEPNDSFLEAADLGTLGDRTEADLTIYESGNDDYYLLTAVNSGTLNVDILFSHSFGNLDLYVYDSSQSLLAESYSSTDNEGVSVAVTGGQTYYVRVLGYAGATNSRYDLVIDGPEPPADHFEPNDSFAEAADLGVLGNLTEAGLTIHEFYNEDFYLLTAVNSGILNVDILFSHSFGNLDLYVYDSSYTLLASSDTTTDNESVSVAVTGGQTYYVQVLDSAGATNRDYDLVINGPEVPDRFEPNDRDWEAPDLGTLGNRTETGLTIHDSDDNDYYLLTAADSGTLNVDILFSHSLGDLDLIVFDSYTMLGRSSTRTDNESLSVEVIGGETYWVRVYGLSGATHPDYDLVIDGP
jgi:hypothetical protein